MCKVIGVFIMVIATAMGAARNRKLFGVYVYDDMGKGTIPSGWNNPNQRGCNAIVNATRRKELLDFLTDSTNAVSVVKLSANPLAKNNDTYWPVYRDMIATLAASNITAHLMVSDTPSDFVTWQAAFHLGVDTLSAAVPHARIGVTYDVEGDEDDAKLWDEMYGIITKYANRAQATRPRSWAGFTFWGPYISYDSGAPLYAQASSIEWGTYSSGAPEDFKNSLAKLAQFNHSAKVSVGLEMGLEHGLHCDDYSTCTGSMLWGKGVDNTTQSSLQDWVDQVMYPHLRELKIVDRLAADAPFYVESVAGFMAFQDNIKKGLLPCTSCKYSPETNKDFWCAPAHYRR